MLNDRSNLRMLPVAGEHKEPPPDPKDIALDEVLNAFRAVEKHLEEKILINLDLLVMPLINQLMVAKSYQPKILELLRTNINEVMSNFGIKLRSIHPSLSAKELEIANMIRKGHGTKEIAELLGLSPHTVITHRHRIRKKLNIKNDKVNLATYLNQFS